MLADLSLVGYGARLPRIAYFAKLGPQFGEYVPGPSKVGEVPSSTVTLYFCLMLMSASSVGCGMAPCIVNSQNRATGSQTDEPTPAPQLFPLLTRSPSRVVCIWCLDNRAEWDAAADCLALRISPNWTLELANASRRAKGTRIKYFRRVR